MKRFGLGCKPSPAKSKFYGIPLPQLFPTNPDWEALTSSLHYYSAYLFLGLFLLPVLGVIMHQVRGLEILRRIT
jgi:cytochrome b561